MIKVSFLYPYRENGRFDVDYYCGTHMPLAAKLFGAALKGWSVDVGMHGREPGSAPPFVAVGHLLFESVAAFHAAAGPVGSALTADVPNFTDGGLSTMLISEIKAGA